MDIGILKRVLRGRQETPEERYRRDAAALALGSRQLSSSVNPDELWAAGSQHSKVKRAGATLTAVLVSNVCGGCGGCGCGG